MEKTIINALRRRYDLEIDAPFVLEIDCVTHHFQYRIRGYGATNGMIVDRNFDKIEPVREMLVDMGYGYSCFDLSGNENSNHIQEKLDGWQEVLDDWGN